MKSPNESEKITVIYIVGSGHSGSTLLDCIISNNQNVFSAGELSFYNVIKNQQPHIKTRHRKGVFCACGKKMLNCGFWRKVIKHDVCNCQIKKIYTKKENWQYFLKSLNLNKIPRGTFRKSDFDLLKIISQESGCRIVLDSSKDPRRLLDLYRDERIDIRVVYLVRDGRDYMLSMSRKRRQKSGLPRKSYLTSLLEWAVINWVSRKIVRQRKFPFVKISYRELCQSPEKTIALISQKLKIPLHYSTANHIRHNLSGNINTLNQKGIKIDYQENWKKEIAPIRRFFLSILFSPFRLWLEDEI